MAPPSTYVAPHHQLGRLMVEARRRGMGFDAWWLEAMRPDEPVVMTTHANPPAGAVVWPTDYTDRTSWREALLATKQEWRRAYERAEPTKAERAIAALADAIDLLGGVALVQAA